MAGLRQIPEQLTGRILTFAGGVHPPGCKQFSAGLAIERAPLPPEVMLPVAMHVGAPAVPVVAKKDTVTRGQVVAEAGGFISAPIHSPVAGTVSDVTPRLHQNGRMVPTIIIKTDKQETSAAIAAEETQMVRADEDLAPYAPEQITTAVKAAGIVGLGGAAFPSFVKAMPNKQHPTDIVILNGTECEPYLTADHRLMCEHAAPIIAGLRLAMKATGAPQGAIGIEDNKRDAIRALTEMLHGLDIPERIEVCTLRTKYPQGGERSLIPAITGRAVPVGGFPPDIGVAIFNVGTAAAIAPAVIHGRPLVERVLTLTGSGMVNPANLLALIGSPLSFLIDARGGLREDAAMVILGGPMMGPTAASLDLPVLKGMSGVTVPLRAETPAHREHACIRCGRCVDACPLDLMPALLAQLGQRKLATEAQAANAMACVECGCCSYVCPSHIPLVQYIRSAKTQVGQLQRKN